MCPKIGARPKQFIERAAGRALVYFRTAPHLFCRVAAFALPCVRFLLYSLPTECGVSVSDATRLGRTVALYHQIHTVTPDSLPTEFGASVSEATRLGRAVALYHQIHILTPVSRAYSVPLFLTAAGACSQVVEDGEIIGLRLYTVRARSARPSRALSSAVPRLERPCGCHPSPPLRAAAACQPLTASAVHPVQLY
jgi:hypothetical protein